MISLSGEIVWSTKYHKVNTTQHVTKNLCRNYTSTRYKNHGGYRKCNSGVERISGNDEWPFVHWPFVWVAFCPLAFLSDWPFVLEPYCSIALLKIFIIFTIYHLSISVILIYPLLYIINFSKLRFRVKNERTLISAKKCVDLSSISEVRSYITEWPRFFDPPCISYTIASSRQ